MAGSLFMGINTGLLYLLVHFSKFSVPIATMLAAESCTILRYLLNDIWVFRSCKLTWLKLWRYHLANALASIVWWIAANILTRVGFNYIAASILAVVFSTGVSFASNVLWIWRPITPGN